MSLRDIGTDESTGTCACAFDGAVSHRKCYFVTITKVQLADVRQVRPGSGLVQVKVVRPLPFRVKAGIDPVKNDSAII